MDRNYKNFSSLRRAYPLRNSEDQNCFDFIEFKEQDIRDYLKRDPNNRVLRLMKSNGDEEAICTTLDELEERKGYRDQIFFECLSNNHRFVRNMRSASRYGYIQFNFPSMNIITPYNILYQQCPEEGWFFRPTNIILDRTITLAAARGDDESYVSASHCQRGTSRRVYTFSWNPYEGFDNVDMFVEITRT
jgi:hypothetical protein